MSKINWIPKQGEDFYWIDQRQTYKVLCRTAISDTDYTDSLDIFRTHGQAKEAAKRIKDCLEAYHEEIGE